jgi:hypothetical protein
MHRLTESVAISREQLAPCDAVNIREPEARPWDLQVARGGDHGPVRNGRQMAIRSTAICGRMRSRIERCRTSPRA